MKRIFTAFAFVAAVIATMLSVTPARAAQSRAIVSAQGNPYLTDFTIRESKRGDLRIEVAHHGLDAAFSEWLSTEHPDAYRQAVSQRARPAAQSPQRAAERIHRATGLCCIMSSGCCPMCPTCCQQKSCTKGCCSLTACINRPDCCK